MLFGLFRYPHRGFRTDSGATVHLLEEIIILLPVPLLRLLLSLPILELLLVLVVKEVELGEEHVVILNNLLTRW